MKTEKFDAVLEHIHSAKYVNKVKLESSRLRSDMLSYEAAMTQLRVWDKLEKLVLDALNDATTEETGQWQHESGTRDYFCPRCGGLEHVKRNYCPRCGLHMITPKGKEPTFV